MANIKLAQTLQGNIDNLNNNWMHKVSMSSLELFYSNFFECMFKENFSHILKALNINLKIHSNLKLVIEREYHLGVNKGKNKEEITDIMIGFEITINKKQIIIPYIIIENKVKSYPRNEQLKGQHDALKQQLLKQLKLVQKNIQSSICSFVANFYGINSNTNVDADIDTIVQKCHEILLTYIPAHKDVLNGTGFKQLLYKDFCNNINPCQFKNHSQYVKDYHDMIRDICVVLEKLTDTNGNNVIDYTNSNLANHLYYMADEFEVLQAIDFQDVFRKYQASLLEAYLVQLFIDSSNSTYRDTGIHVRTESLMNDKNGTTTFFLVLDGPAVRGKENLSIGVQVQGKQFRVMVVGKKIEKIYNKPKLLPNCIIELWNNNSISEGKGRSNDNFNSYKPDCIYKYVDINKEWKKRPTFYELGTKIGNVLEYIVTNRTTLENNIP